MSKKRFKSCTLEDEELGINPFQFPLKVVVKEMSVRTNEYTIEGENISTVIQVEATPYCKVFATSDIRKYISKLEFAAKSLFLWILLDVKPSKEYIDINKERYMEEAGVSLTTYKKGLTELQDRGLIYSNPKARNIYWINPSFFFKGNRIKKYPDQVVKYVPYKDK